MNGNAVQPGFDGRTMPGLAVWWGLMVAIGGGSLVIATVAAASGEPISGGWQAGFLGMAGALLLPIPFWVLDRLHAERRVWVGRAAPRASWQAALRGSRRTWLISWALAAVPLVLMRLLTRPAFEAWITALPMVLLPAALLAAVLGLGLLAAAAWQGLVAWPVGLAALVGAIALLTWGAQADAPAVPPARVEHLGGPVAVGVAGTLACLLAAGLAWQAMCVVHRALDQAQELAQRQPSPGERLQALRVRWAEQWRRVDPAVNLWLFGGFFSQLPANLTNVNIDARFLQAWGSTVSPLHGFRLALLTLVASALLRGAAPHWRLLLAPGSGFRRVVGLRVVGSTLATVVLQFGFLLAVFVPVFWVVTAAVGEPASFPRHPASIALPLMADLTLAVALAAWLRGWLGSLGRVVSAIAGLSAAWAAIVFLAAPLLGLEGFARSTLWSRGPGYLAGQLALAACFTLLAQRVWARADLGAMARQPRSTPEEER